MCLLVLWSFLVVKFYISLRVYSSHLGEGAVGGRPRRIYSCSKQYSTHPSFWYICHLETSGVNIFVCYKVFHLYWPKLSNYVDKVIFFQSLKCLLLFGLVHVLFQQYHKNDWNYKYYCVSWLTGGFLTVFPPKKYKFRDDVIKKYQKHLPSLVANSLWLLTQ